MSDYIKRENAIKWLKNLFVEQMNKATKSLNKAFTNALYGQERRVL